MNRGCPCTVLLWAFCRQVDLSGDHSVSRGELMEFLERKQVELNYEDGQRAQTEGLSREGLEALKGMMSEVQQEGGDGGEYEMAIFEWNQMFVEWDVGRVLTYTTVRLTEEQEALRAHSKSVNVATDTEEEDAGATGDRKKKDILVYIKQVLGHVALVDECPPDCIHPCIHVYM